MHLMIKQISPDHSKLRNLSQLWCICIKSINEIRTYMHLNISAIGHDINNLKHREQTAGIDRHSYSCVILTVTINSSKLNSLCIQF